MVFGIGEGNITITTEKQSYVQGELLKGQVILNLNSVKNARALRIQFYGEHHSSIRHRSDSVGSMGSRNIERIYTQEIVLDGQKDYQPGTKEYTFQFQLPTIPKPPMIQDNGIVGTIANCFMGFIDPFSNVRWYLDVSLDIPMSLDINKRQQINFVR